METTSMVWIAVAVIVGIALIAAIVMLSRRTQHKHRQVEAERIREEARGEELRVNRREALAQETEARAKAAQAEAEAKAAEAARLADRAQVRRDDAASSRDQLDAQWQRADELDPKRNRVDDDEVDRRLGDGFDQPIADARDPRDVNRDANPAGPDVRHPQHR